MHLRGCGCSVCGGTKKKTPEEYLQECKEKGLDLPIEDYVNVTTKIKHKCKQGHIYLQRPSKHLQGHGCRVCGNINKVVNRTGKTKKRTSKEYYDLCKDKGLDLPTEDYIDSHTGIKHRCDKGHIYKQRPIDHLKGNGCSKCKKCYSYTPEEYYNLCKQMGLDLPIENYVNTKTKINYKCKQGHIYPQIPCNHYIQGCPVCKESHGEKYIRNYLDKNNIEYEPQKKFKDLKDKTYLSYDFYLPEHSILIEYQGIQHYEPVSFNGKDYSNLGKQKYHDKLKQCFAKESGYKLLRPTYKMDTQEKINRYLDRYLLKSLTNN